MAPMRHFVFPSTAQADAFIADLRSQNLIQQDIQTASFRRRTPVTTGTTTQTVTTEVVDGGGDTGEMVGGALKGGVIGTAAGLAAGAVVAATGGLAAIPVILGLGLGATAGMTDAALHGDGNEENARRTALERHTDYDLDDDHYDRLNSAAVNDNRLVAVEDNVDHAAVDAAAARHGGREA